MSGILLLTRPPAAPSLLKPTGTPVIDTGNPLTSGLLYYVFDTGQSEYKVLQDCSPGHLVYPPAIYGGGGSGSDPSSIPSLNTTSYGTAFKFPGITAESSTIAGFTSYVNAPDAIRTAQNLYTQSTGAGLTIATWYVQEADNANNGLIFGRTARGFTEAAPFASLAISNDAANKVRLWYYQNGQSSASVMESPSGYSYNVLHSAIATFVNDSAGSATLKFYVDGTQVGTTSGVALADTFGSENDEGQIMLGSSWHLFANHVSNVFQGNVMAGAYWTRDLTSTECSQLNASPWRMFL